LLKEYGWEVLEHPAYCSDFATSDFHLFPTLKEFLGDRLFKRDEEVEDAAKQWLTLRVPNLFLNFSTPCM
jgi:hypothetical protein